MLGCADFLLSGGSFACMQSKSRPFPKACGRDPEAQSVRGFFSAANNFMDHSFELIGRMGGSDADHVSPGWYFSENLNNFYFSKGRTAG